MLSSLVRTSVSHAIATAILVVAAGVLAVALFVVLYVVAIATNAPLGSPIAAPLWILFALAASATIALLCFFPATVSGAFLARTLRLPVLFEISLAALFSLLASCAWGSLIGAWAGGLLAGLQAGAVVGGVLLLPLGLYWWSVRSTDWLISLLRQAGLKVSNRARSLSTS